MGGSPGVGGWRTDAVDCCRNPAETYTLAIDFKRGIKAYAFLDDSE